MTFCQKLETITKRFDIDDKKFSKILNIKLKRFEELKSGKSEPTKEELETFKEVLNIKPKNMLNENYDLPLLTMTTKINMAKYKNIFNAYTEILKENYPEPWEVYVLAKIKNKTGFEAFWDSIFKDFKKEMNEEMGRFTPNYLAIKEDIHLLISIKDGILEVSELPEVSEQKRFTHGNYRYARANKIQLKKPENNIDNYY